MVLKFEEYINEGLWSKGLERAQTGDKRLEDKNKFVDICKEFFGTDFDFSFKVVGKRNIRIQIYYNISDEPIAEYNTIEKLPNKTYMIVDSLGKPYSENNTDVDVEMLINEDDNDDYYDLLGILTSWTFVEMVNDKLKEYK